MLWRMTKIWEEYENVCCRDLDSILTPRQLKYTTVFIQSKKTAHSICDNLSHNIPLMGGMCSFNCKKFIDLTGLKSFSDMIYSAHKDRTWWSTHGSDQDFLMEHIYPKIKNDFILHKVEGENDRSYLKNCVPGLTINHVNEKIMSEGDNFTNFVGASNCHSTTYGNWTLKQICDFYDVYGNQEMIARIKEIE